MSLSRYRERITRAMATNPDESVPVVPLQAFVRHDEITEEVESIVRKLIIQHKIRTMPGLLTRTDLQSGFYLSAGAAGILWDKYGDKGTHDPKTGEAR